MWARQAKQAEEMENRWTVVKSKIPPCRHHTNVHSDTLSIAYTHVRVFFSNASHKFIQNLRMDSSGILFMLSFSFSCSHCLSGLQWPFWIMDGVSLLVTVTKTTIPLCFYISLKCIIRLPLGLLLSHFPCSLFLFLFPSLTLSIRISVKAP